MQLQPSNSTARYPSQIPEQVGHVQNVHNSTLIFILSYAGHFTSIYYLDFFFHLLILKVVFGCLLHLINQIVTSGEKIKTIFNPVLLKNIFVKFKLLRLRFYYNFILKAFILSIFLLLVNEKNMHKRTKNSLNQ